VFIFVNVTGRSTQNSTSKPTETSKQSDNIFTQQAWASILAGMQLVALKILKLRISI